MIKLSQKQSPVEGGLVAYMNKNGVPIPGNITMNIPIKIGIDPYDLMMDGIHFLESKGIEGI